MTEKIRIESDDWGNRFHIYPQSNGGEVRCGGPKFCRECNREAARREAVKRPI